MRTLILLPLSYISLVRLSIRRIMQGLKCAKGAHIGFSGAVYTDGPSAEVLSVTLPLCVPETNVEIRTLAAFILVCSRRLSSHYRNTTTRNHSEVYTLYQMHDTHSNLPSRHFTLPQDAASSSCCQYRANWFSWPSRRVTRKCVSNSLVSIQWRPIQYALPLDDSACAMIP